MIRLRLALYGPEDAQALMRRCYRRSKSDHINERTVWAAWQEQDDALDAALGFSPAQERRDRVAAFLADQSAKRTEQGR